MAESQTNGAKQAVNQWDGIRVGKLQLEHRIVMSPLTRARCPAQLPSEMNVEYYSQRATKGGLLISEGIHPSLMGGNYYSVPSMYSPEHIREWKKVTDAVHAKGGFIYAQIWHVGRVSVSSCLGGRKPLGPSTTKLDFVSIFTPNGPTPSEEPQQMTLQDIKDTIADHVHSAKCAIQAGFDGVEIQGANGYLFEQFINNNINNPLLVYNINNTRNDEYAGPIENRARLSLEVLQAVSAEIGADRVGVRFSPFNAHYMPIGLDDPIGDFSWLLERVDKLGLAYVTLMDPCADLFISGSARMAKQYEAAMARGVPRDKVRQAVSLKPLRKCLKNTVALTSGGYDATNWVQPIRDGDFDGIVFGRQFVSNPDLVERLRNGWPLATPDKKTFYTPGPVGYIDYPRWTGKDVAVKTIS